MPPSTPSHTRSSETQGKRIGNAFAIYKTADGCKAGWTKAQLLPEGRSADGAALSQFTISRNSRAKRVPAERRRKRNFENNAGCWLESVRRYDVPS